MILLRRRVLIPIALAVLVGLPVWLSALYIAPHAVFIDHDSRSAEVTLGNSGDEPEEVTVDIVFGYPDTDSTGAAFIRFIDAPGPDLPSAADWIRAFPRRVRLEPGERQLVRLLAAPPAELPDGEYWARLMVTSRSAAIPVSTADTNVRAGVELELRLVVSVTYRKGELETGIVLHGLDASADRDSLVAWMHVERAGTASYLGIAEFTVGDSTGAAVREWSIPIAVYYEMNRRFVFPLDGLPSGAYTLALRLATEREDLEEKNVLLAAPVEDTVAFEVR